MSLFVCSRTWQPRKTFYVEAVPGSGGKDWGYTASASKAKPINAYWTRRFKADMRRVGSSASCTKVVR